MNPAHTTVEFDVTLTHPADTSSANREYVGRFQNNIQSIFQRVRIMYGSTPLEDLINYNVIVRNLTEWGSGNPHMCMDQSTISEGIGGITWGADRDGNPGVVNVRSKYIQGMTANAVSPASPVGAGHGWDSVPNTLAGNGVTLPPGHSSTLRRYQVQLAAGLFTQEKLVSYNLTMRSLPNSWHPN